MTCDVCQKPKDNFSGFWQGWEEGGLGQLLDLWRCWEGKGMGLSVWGLRLLPIAALHAHFLDGHKPPVTAKELVRWDFDRAQQQLADSRTCCEWRDEQWQKCPPRAR